jgi:23S rRNA A2030 N6-methylase RlmJ
MWICLYDCFLSIVAKDCAPDELLVRARRPGDIEKIFKGVKVTKYTKSDYLFRAVVKKADVIKAMALEIEDIDYDNFKSAVQDDKLHRAYLDMWCTMSALQPTVPYSGSTNGKFR